VLTLVVGVALATLGVGISLTTLGVGGSLATLGAAGCCSCGGFVVVSNVTRLLCVGAGVGLTGILGCDFFELIAVFYIYKRRC
jgi:hypothetical protein